MAGRARQPKTLMEAMEAAVSYVSYRPRSEREIRLRLARERLAAEDVEEILTRLRRLGLADDRAFAHYWADQRRTFNPRGPRALRAELQQRGVGQSTAEEVATTSATWEAEGAYEAANKRARSLPRDDERTFRTRLDQFLTRRGFGWQTVRATVDQVWQESE